MFTGIVTDIGQVVAVEDFQGSLRRLRILTEYDAATDAHLNWLRGCRLIMSFRPQRSKRSIPGSGAGAPSNCSIRSRTSSATP